MVRVFKTSIRLFMLLGFICLIPKEARAEDPKVEDLGETFILRKEAQKRFKITRVTSDEQLKAWVDASKNEALLELKKFMESQAGVALVASTEAALANLQDEAFVSSLMGTLNQVERKGWLDVFKDLQSQMNQKNLRIEDLVNNPQIVSSYIETLKEKERDFWAKRAKAQASKIGAPITETATDVNVPTGSLKEGLMLIKALSTYLKVEVKEPGLDNLLIRYFIKA